MKAPPTYSNHPAATENDPVMPGITIISSRDCGSFNRWEFVINRGEEDIAINSLLNALLEFSEFSLADYSQGDSESCMTFRRDGAQFKAIFGGHGWSGEWKTLEREWAIYEAEKRVKYNYGPRIHNSGHLIKSSC